MTGLDAVDDLIAETPSTDGILCSADTTATGVLEGLGQMGKSVPSHAAATGFADIDLAQHTTPSLTSVRMRLYETDATAVAVLLENVAYARVTPRPRLLQTSLARRESARI